MGKSRSPRRASHQPTLMDSCLTIIHTCFPCLLSYELVLVLLVLLKEVKMLRRCKTSLAQGICYSQKYMLLRVMVVGFEKTVFPSHR